jgi:ABC-type glycerol-3-phosphate transport system substrate-binding protein
VAQEPAPLRIWVAAETDARNYRSLVELYRRKKAPGFLAEVRAFGYSEMPDKLRVAVRTGVGAPDVVQIDQVFFSLYLGDEMPFLDLTSRVKAAGLDRSLLPQRMALFAHDGRVYGLPQSVSAVLLYYREDLLAKWGVRETDLDTWDGLLGAGRAVKARGGPALLSLDWSYFEILLRQRGFDVFDAQGRPALEQLAAEDTLEFLVRLARERAGLNPDRGTIFDPAFFQGDVAHDESMALLGADWYGLDMIRGMAPGLAGRWRARPLPAWKDALSRSARRTSSFAGEGLLVLRSSKRAEEAWDFVRFVMEDRDANVERWLQGNCLTAHQPSWQDPRLVRPEPYFGGQALAGLLVKLAPDLPAENTSPHKAALVNLWREKYWAPVIGGSLPPHQALREMQQELLRPR